MKTKFKFFALAALLMALAGPALAKTYYSLWIHGMSLRLDGGSLNKERKYGDFSYWGPLDLTTADAGVNPRAVNWNGMTSVETTNKFIVQALDRYCTGTNWCYIAAHSTGDLHIGYALANEGLRERTVHYCHTPGQVPMDQDECFPGRKKQIGWNIVDVRIAGGAAGGSEAAGLFNAIGAGASYVVKQFFSHVLGEEATRAAIAFISEGWGLIVLRDLGPINARALYDHNVTAGVTFLMHSGAQHRKFWLAEVGLLGDDDNLVPYHSSGGVAGSSGRPLCNERSWSCGELTEGTGPNYNSTSNWWHPSLFRGGEKWHNHDVEFRDVDQQYGHGSGDGPKSWGGIIGVVKSKMNEHAVPRYD